MQIVSDEILVKMVQYLILRLKMFNRISRLQTYLQYNFEIWKLW